MRMIPASDDRWLSPALEHLRGGGVLALPTETVYGLAASIHTSAGVERIYELKNRAVEKALPWQVDSLECAIELGFTFTPGALAVARRFWPGPLTLLLGRPRTCPDWFAPDASLLALRIPDHPPAARLLEAWGAPLAVTSANRSGQPECLDAEAVAHAFPDAGDLLILDGGPSPGGMASTVVDASGQEPRIMREGPITADAILAAWLGRS